MNLLLRESRSAATGIGEYRDIEISLDDVTLGSAPDCSIQLLGTAVLPKHAEFRLTSRGELVIVCARGGDVLVNDKPLGRATLSVGDRVQVGGNRLDVFEPPAGFDAGLQLERDAAVDASAFESAFRTDLDQVWLSPRAFAWTLSAVIVATAFALPLLSAQGKLPGLEDLPFVPSDALWTSGPLLRAHQLATGNSCVTCHQVPFQRVRDEACTECHTQIDDHVTSVLTADAAGAHLTERCATCHREHGEPESHIVISADTLCTDCHAESRAAFEQQNIERVSGFSAEAHPEFEATLYTPVSRRAGTGIDFDWQYVDEAVSTATEMSNLRFPHDLHLDPDKVTDPHDSSPLGCVSCHRISLDREHFIPVTMRGVCIDCHELTFDPQMPDRQLPHGQPLEVILTIEGQYLRSFSDPAVDNKAVAARRIPDKENGVRVCVDTAFACAAKAAAEEVEEQFTVRGCAGCHIVESHADSDIYSRYQVHPVRLAVDYFPRTHFDHASHELMKDLTGDAACLECHDARASAESSDLLLPDIRTCAECHANVATAGPVPLPCVSCHAYHPAPFPFTAAAELP